MIKYQSIYLLPIALLFCININAQIPKKMVLNFENKTQIVEWGEKEFGYIGDSININIDGTNIFILLGDYSSGVQRKTIFVFLENLKKEWGLMSIRNTNTSSVKVDVDRERNEIVFKAKSGKTLMTLPFETLNLNFDTLER